MPKQKRKPVIHWRTRRKMEAAEKAKQEEEKKHDGALMVTSLPVSDQQLVNSLRQQLLKAERRGDDAQDFLSGLANQLRGIANQVEAFTRINRGY